MAFEDDEDTGGYDEPEEGDEDERPAGEPEEGGQDPDELAAQLLGQAKEEQPQRQPDPHVENLNRALKAQRAKTREMRAKLEQLEAAEERRAARFERLLGAVAKEQGLDPGAILSDAPPPPPSRDEDPVGHLEHRVGELLAPLQQAVQTLLGAQTEAQVEAKVKEVHAYHDADIAGFRQAQAPDYDDAEDYLTGSMFNQAYALLEQKYPDLDEDELEARTWAGLQEVAAELQIKYARSGKSLAAAVYKQAIERGYQPAAQRGEPRKAPGGRRMDKLRQQVRNGAASAATAKPASSTKAVLDRVLSSAMDDDEFDRLTSTPGAWKKLAAAAAGV